VNDRNFQTLLIGRVIFHDVPRNPRHAHTEPVLSEAPSPLDPPRVQHLKAGAIRTLQSKHAYPIKLDEQSGSPLPALIRQFLSTRRTEAGFIDASVAMARYLHGQQTGASSDGLLTIMECVSDGRPCMIVLKLEREAGAQLNQANIGGKRTFTMDVMQNLVLTDGTRLFKSAMFVLLADGNLDGISCDDQRSQGFGDAMAQFWRRFLGAEYLHDPRIQTQDFFNATMEFVNYKIEDPAQKADLYDHLLSELKSEKKNFSPKAFIDDYVPADLKDDFEEHLAEKDIPLRQFKVNTTNIINRLKRRLFRTSRGATITVPENEEVTVRFEPERVVVEDFVVTVGNK